MKNRRNRSYGFIDGYDGESYWFSLKGIEDIKPGMEVSFKGGQNEKGFVARDVHIIA
jgi:cold shock CspA family protein